MHALEAGVLYVLMSIKKVLITIGKTKPYLWLG
jgi:hypothetical protein